jgi:aminoglycoside phosphotransferase family enzyme/predicted kinase/nucleotide-binding universal stress UspA family protein
VVVGVDDGLLRTEVLDRAVDEARRGDGSVQVVHVHGADTATAGDDAGARAVAYLARTAGDVAARSTCADGDPSDALVAASQVGSLMVLGARGERRGSLAGTTTERAVLDAPCPVLVLPEHRLPRGGAPAAGVVVVGADESPGGREALIRAVAIARHRGLVVVAVRTWDEVQSEPDGTPRRRSAEEGDEVEARARVGLGELVRAQGNDVPISTVVEADRPARRLLSEARGAGLLVVAHRAHHGAPGLGGVGLGSTTRSVLTGASCPVLVLGPRVVAEAEAARGEPAPFGAAPAPTPTRVGLDPAVRETHTAVLWFAGDRVHKMKKAVDLGFCDFTTPELRRRGCEREVALNRRLSPEAYLGVATVVGPGAGDEEHLVVMRRMPEDRRLAALVTAGEPVEDHLRAIARRLAAFHATARRGSEIDREGSVEAAGRRWSGVLDTLWAHAGSVLDPGLVESVDGAAREFLAGRRDLFEARVADGRIVDGHADLLADDVFCLPDGPVILDCLEFDDRLRFVDGLDDAAFLAMDLERLGGPVVGPNLATRFLELYAEFRADPAPPASVHHFVAYRAAVRASVACLRLDQGGDGAATARGLMELAESHLDAGRVRLVLVGGLPGTGKSTVAGGLGDRLGAVVLSSDRLRKEIADRTPTDPAGAAYRDGLYRPEHTEATYAEMLHRAEELLARGESVVLDASWTDGHLRTAAAAVAARTHSRLAALHCEVPRAVADARIRVRSGSASDATPMVAAVMSADADPWPEAVPVDTSGSIEHSVQAALSGVRSRRPRPTWTMVPDVRG